MDVDREQIRLLIQQAAMRGGDVNIDFASHAVKILRSLADEIESGTKQVGLAEMRLIQENRPFSTYVVAVKDA